jgi:hypothetical protein
LVKQVRVFLQRPVQQPLYAARFAGILVIMGVVLGGGRPDQLLLRHGSQVARQRGHHLAVALGH